jgi:copper chaperone
MTSATYQVTGMTCEHCAHAVTQELENLGGVQDVTVELNPGGSSAVTVSSNAPLTADDDRAVELAIGGMTGDGLPSGSVITHENCPVRPLVPSRRDE